MGTSTDTMRLMWWGVIVRVVMMGTRGVYWPLILQVYVYFIVTGYLCIYCTTPSGFELYIYICLYIHSHIQGVRGESDSFMR